MALVHRSQLNSYFYTGAQALAIKYLLDNSFPPAELAPLLLVKTVDLPDQVFAWPGDVPTMEKGPIASAPEKDVSFYNQSVSVENFYLDIPFDYDSIADDKFGLLAQIMGMGMDSAIRKGRTELAAMLMNGFGTTCADGQNFFDTDHPTLSGTYSNDGAANTFIRANVVTALVAMMNVQSDQDSFRGIAPDTVIVPPALKDEAKRIFEADLIVGAHTYAESNILKGEVTKRVVMPEITVTTNWFLADTGKTSKPLILVIREAPHTKRIDDPKKEVLYVRVKARYEHTYFDPAVIYGAEGV